MNKSNLRVLITGSEGVIGRVLVKAFLSKYEIVGVDKNTSLLGSSHKIDISKMCDLERVFRRHLPVGCIIHLAAIHPGANNGEDPRWDQVLKHNVLGTINVFEFARKFKVKKVIFASTNHVTEGHERASPSLYKKKHPRMITPRDPIRPSSNYATSKAFGEAIARQYFEQYNIKSICIRFGSVFEDDDPAQNKRYLKTWLSHRDLIDLIGKSIESNVGFGIYYGVSANKGRFWDISNAIESLGYDPRDDGSKKG